MLVIVFHVGTQSHVSAQKHLAFALVFFCPVAGLGAYQLVKRLRLRAAFGIVIIALLSGVAQWSRLASVWPDSRVVADYLAENWTTGQVLAAEDGWSYRMPLYWQGLVASPYNVLDSWNLEHGKRDLCDLDWLVGKIYDGEEDRVVKLARKCGFQPVFADSSIGMTGLDHGTIRHFPIELIVYRRKPTG